jgi:hypothetical protein
MLIEVTTNSAYGTERIYPANDAARTLAKIAGTTTLSLATLEHAVKLGHTLGIADRSRTTDMTRQIQKITGTAVFRVSYTERGRAEHTGMYFDREACIQTLGSFRRAGRAWLQESNDNGRTWQTVNV